MGTGNGAENLPNRTGRVYTHSYRIRPVNAVMGSPDDYEGVADSEKRSHGNGPPSLDLLPVPCSYLVWLSPGSGAI